LLAKKVCSPAEKMNSSEQSRQVSVRSWYTLWFLLGANAERPAPGLLGGRSVVREPRREVRAVWFGRVPARNPSGENTRGVKRSADPVSVSSRGPGLITLAGTKCGTA
jgi:hypothetical protein